MTSRTIEHVRSTWPDTYGRIRSACSEAAATIDLDEYAAQVTLTVVRLKERATVEEATRILVAAGRRAAV